jgi:UDPglucose 6-dehydrogenase
MTQSPTATPREPIGVIGTGYVGLVTAAGFTELVGRHRHRLHFSTDIRDAIEHTRLLFVAVGTPPTHSGDADLSAVHAVV